MKLRQARNALALLLVAVAAATTVMLRQRIPPIVPAAHRETAGNWTAASRPLRFLVRADCPPFSTLPPEGGLPTGVDPDLALALAAHLGVDCTLVAIPHREIVSRFLNGEGDVLAAAVSFDSPQGERLDFTLPCYRSRGVMVVPAAAVARLAQGLPEPPRLGLLAGAARGDTMLQGLDCQEPATEVQSWEELVACLRENRCDAVLADVLTAHYLLSSHPDCGLSLLPMSLPNRHPSAVCLAVRKGATDLRRSLDGALRDLEMDGTLRRLHHRYFPFDIE